MRPGLAAPGPAGVANLRRARRRGRPRHVAKITIYVAGHQNECLPAIDAARAGLFVDTTGSLRDGG